MMDVFDSLPPVVRRAIAGAGHPLEPRIAARLLARGRSPGYVAAFAMAFDRRMARLLAAAGGGA